MAKVKMFLKKPRALKVKHFKPKMFKVRMPKIGPSVSLMKKFRVK